MSVSRLTVLESTRLVDDLVETPQSIGGQYSGPPSAGLDDPAKPKDSPFQDVVVAFLGINLSQTVYILDGFAEECVAAARV